MSSSESLSKTVSSASAESAVVSPVLPNLGVRNTKSDYFVQTLLTDYYQITMMYGYFQAQKHKDHAVFDVFFRKNPFQGEFTIFAGLGDVLRYVKHFKFSPSDIEFVKSLLPGAEESFFTYLAELDTSEVEIRAIAEGSVVFPRVPLVTVCGPLGVCQLMETAVLNLINFSSLVATNAARFRLAAGSEKRLLEFGLRRAQGPNGGIAASKYCYMGGFDGTSNVLAGKLFGIPVSGTMAHSFVCAFASADDLVHRTITLADGGSVDLYELAMTKRRLLEQDMASFTKTKNPPNDGELCAFVAYALSFPSGFLALLDTYDTLNSGVVNFIAVALALADCGFTARGCRIDSGDLSYLSKEIRKRLSEVNDKLFPSGTTWFSKLSIVASNDINEETILSLNEQRHDIDCFGIGTHLVTCQKQPALGCVYKLVSLNGNPTIKISQDASKISIPCIKSPFRLYAQSGYAIFDILLLESEDAPVVQQSQMCRHPFEDRKQAIVVPSSVKKLHSVVWHNNEITSFVTQELAGLRDDHKRVLNPTPYKVSVSPTLHDVLHQIWMSKAGPGYFE